MLALEEFARYIYILGLILLAFAQSLITAMKHLCIRSGKYLCKLITSGIFNWHLQELSPGDARLCRNKGVTEQAMSLQVSLIDSMSRAAVTVKNCHAKTMHGRV